MKKMKCFAAVLTAFLMLFTGVTAYGEEVVEQIRVIINGVDVTDDMPVKPQLVDGEVVAPVSVIAEALGATVTFDEHGSIIIDTTKPVVPSGDIGARLNPVPVGTTVLFNSMDRSYDAYEIELTLTEVFRGAEAWDLVYKAYKYNDEPGEGLEYVLTKFSVKALDSKDDDKISIDHYDFYFYNSKGVRIDSVRVYDLKPEFTDMYSGGEIEGYVACIVEIGDTPSIVFRESYNKGVWFSTDVEWEANESVPQIGLDTDSEEVKEYKGSAKTIAYTDLVREPDKYKGETIKITVSISQIMQTGYRAYGGSNEWYIYYSLPKDAPRIIEDDTVVFYGTYMGLEEMTRAIGGTKVYVPRINAKYHEIK